MNEDFKLELTKAYLTCCLLYDAAESQGLINEQFFLDWLDNLNKLSIKN